MKPRFTRTALDVSYADYRRYKPQLRIDFRKRCAYCDLTEHCAANISAFGIDHFKPKSRFPELETEYANLYYCCNDCNSYKGTVWPSAQFIKKGIYFPDPCQCDPFKEHLEEQRDGNLKPITKAGAFAIEVLRLDRASSVTLRKKKARLQNRMADVHQRLDAIPPKSKFRSLISTILKDLQEELNDCFGDPAQ